MPKSVAYKFESIDFPQMAKMFSDQEIANKLEVNRDTVFRYRKKFSIPTPIHRGRRINGRKFTINHDFFSEINTEERAYILGFISADGCLAKTGNDIRIEVQPKDIDILESIKQCLGSDAPIVEEVRDTGFVKQWHSIKFRVHSATMHADLCRLGVTPTKTFTLLYPTAIPVYLERHYIRGLIDGDGSVFNRKFCLCGTASILAGTQQTILRETGCNLNIRIDKNGFHIMWGFRKHRNAIMWIYGNSTIYLKRKYDIFTKYWQDISRFRGATLRSGGTALIVEPSSYS